MVFGAQPARIVRPVSDSTRTEFIAVPLVSVLLGAIFLVLGAAAVGLWAWIVGGILLLTGIAYGVRRLRQSRLDVAGEVPSAGGQRDPTTYNVLVVADDQCPAEALRRIVEDHAAGRAVAAFVVAPAVSSRLDRITGDEAAFTRANENLESTLDSLEGVSSSRRGKIGSHDPLQAVGEALREFPAEEILVPAGSDRLLAAETRYGVQVTRLSS